MDNYPYNIKMSESFAPLTLFGVICICTCLVGVLIWCVLLSVWDRVWDWIKYFFVDIIWGNLKKFWNWLVDNLFKPVWNAIKEAWNAVVKFFKEVWNWIVEQVKKIWGGFKKLLGKARDEGKKVWEGSKKVFKFIVKIGEDIVSEGKTVIEAIWNFIVDYFKIVYFIWVDLIGKTIFDILKDIGDGIKSIIDIF